MLHILVGETKDERSISSAAKKGTSLPWRVPKRSQLGNPALIELPERGFMAHAEIVTEPHQYGLGTYSARAGSIALLPVPVPIPFIREGLPKWKWPKYPRSYTTIEGAVETRLLKLIRDYQGVTFFSEGSPATITITKYERDPAARHACIQHYGDCCYVCGFSFGKAYGETAQGYIHVHHLREIASAKKEHKVDPIRDLRPVCPNCHAVIHRRKPPLSIKEVKALLREAHH